MSPHLNRKLTASLFLSAVFLLFNVPAFSQLPQLHVTASHADVSQLTVGDIDFQNFGSQHWFFTLNVDGTPNQNVRLFLRIDVALPSAFYGDAVTMETEPFTTPRSISNLDIGKNGTIRTEPGSFHYSNEAKDAVQSLALATGRLPVGTYTFNIKVENVDVPLVADSTQVVLTLQNFSTIELLNPQDEGTVSSPFPLFQWQYDGDKVELLVYEKLPQNQSKEDALSGTPYLDVHSGDPGLPVGVHTFQYPTGGVRALEDGKTYVWTIRSIQSGSGGSDAGSNSQVWEFTVASSGEAPNNPADQYVSTEQISDQLQDIPGVDVAALKQLLTDYQLSGDVYLNGQKISLDELRQLLAELLANPDRIIELKVTNE